MGYTISLLYAVGLMCNIIRMYLSSASTLYGF